jgi:murein DD-endopeptidase MepM/ murein hydrolase activator NlpD
VEPTTSGPALSYARAQRKAKPVPVAKWVNPLPEASLTSCFGQRWGRLHAGIDLAAANGTRLRAAGAGVVVTAGPADGYGNAVLIDHGNGYLTHYGHMSVITVTAGQHVKAGEEIGNEGSTGHSTGPHLHFEVHQGTYKNPIEPTQWMHEHGVDIPGCVTFTDPKAPTKS